MKHNPQYLDTEHTIGIDFDGPIHKNSKGYFDGTIYDKPTKGVESAFKQLKKMGFYLIVYSTKTRPDRIFADGRTGTDHIRMWLEKNNLIKYIKSISCYKPPAKYYIDDNAIYFLTWKKTLKIIMEGKND